MVVHVNAKKLGEMHMPTFFFLGPQAKKKSRLPHHFGFGSCLIFLLSAAVNLPAQNPSTIQSFDKTQIITRITLPNGDVVDKMITPSPPTPPIGFMRATSELPVPNPMAGINTISEVPAFDWSFGCSATSASMIAGYYDRRGYGNMYAGPTNGGVMPLDNSSWPTWEDSNGDTRSQCPLSATHNGLDGRAVNGHVDDYWIFYNQPGPDPFVTNGWTEHTYGDCTGDYMKTNQWSHSNTDGSTTLYWYTSGNPLYWNQMESGGIHIHDGGYGIKLFYESRGYTVINMYNQMIRGQGSNPALGFTYDQYKAEIDAGRPVIIHVVGHTMVGVGYDDATNLVYLHDTWDYSTHSMTWGSTYAGRQQKAVTIVQLAEAEIDIRGDGNSIPDGDTTPSATDLTDFGTVNVGNDVTHSFTIHNTGDYTLYLTGSPAVQITGSTDFTVVSQPSSTTLAPGGSTTFSVVFDPSGTGSKTATISVPNTDLNENPYDFSLQGNGGDVYVLASIKTYLEGPYQAGGSMTTALGSIPTTSPYADGRTVATVPDGVTDWVSVELRSSASGPALIQESFFLKSNGSIVDMDGTTTDLPLPGMATGDYFIVVRHRNHLAIMSASEQTLSSSSASLYDFSTGLGQYYGTDSNRAKEVETGVFGMNAGDASASGTVDASDRSETWNDRNQSGYLNADCNLSGTVDASDRSITWNNRNKSTSVP
jgi:hypothetical protein